MRPQSRRVSPAGGTGFFSANGSDIRSRYTCSCVSIGNDVRECSDAYTDYTLVGSAAVSNFRQVRANSRTRFSSRPALLHQSRRSHAAMPKRSRLTRPARGGRAARSAVRQMQADADVDRRQSRNSAPTRAARQNREAPSATVIEQSSRGYWHKVPRSWSSPSVGGEKGSNVVLDSEVPCIC
jgi:hypothetical protein